MLKQAPARELARGRWSSILPSFGISAEFLTGKHCACPLCGGKDRFRFDNKDGLGTYFCAQCGSGDGFMLAQKVSGKPFKDIAAHIQGLWNTVRSMPQEKRDEIAQQRAIRNAWEGAWQPSPMSPVGLYLGRRLGKPWSSIAIKESSAGMISLVTDANGIPVNVHITHLTRFGDKDANAQVPKRVMPGKLPEGSAIRIWKAAPIMGIAEGIESAMSAAIIFKMPVWSAINASLMAKWIPPQESQEIHIFSDNDENFTGQSKAYALANRLVVQYEKKVIVHIPEEQGKDWNDILLARGLK
ncbi:MAG: hypothetical protein EB015_11725 [Methylocystaceae bacterium]|nr:hypothetical protein [Methylocystaceae bacterium]